MELVKDYDCDISHHPGKANVVPDALSWKSSSSLVTLRQLEKSLQKDFCRLGIELITGSLSMMTLESTLLERVKQGQKEDLELIRHKESVESRKKSDFSVSIDGVIRFQGRLCVPDDNALRKRFYQKRITLHIQFTQALQRCTMI